MIRVMVQVLKKVLQQKRVHIVAVQARLALRKTHHLVKWSIAEHVRIVKVQGKSFLRNVRTCHGEGRVTKNKKIKVTIPEGVDDGQQLRVSGQGEAGYNGGPAGDLYIVFRVRPHEKFIREEDDIYLELGLSYPQAALGDEIEVPTVQGNVNLKIPAGTQTGTRFRLKGKGVKNVHGRGIGDQHVVVKVITPKKMTEKQKELMREFAAISGNSPDEYSSSLFDKIKADNQRRLKGMN